MVYKVVIGAVLLSKKHHLWLDINYAVSESWIHHDNETAAYWDATQKNVYFHLNFLNSHIIFRMIISIFHPYSIDAVV